MSYQTPRKVNTRGIRQTPRNKASELSRVVQGNEPTLKTHLVVVMGFIVIATLIAQLYFR